MHSFKRAILAALFIAVPALAFAQTAVTDQVPIPLGTTGQSELVTQSQSVTGGTLFTTVVRQSGQQGQIQGVASAFVSTAAGGGLVRYLPLTDGKSDLGVPMTAAAGTPSGTPAITRVAGTSMVLTGEATSGAAAKTDKVIFEFDLPSTYVAGANIPVVVNCNYSGTVVTTASTTMTPQLYTETNGVEAAVTTSAVQLIPATAGNLTFTVTGTSLVPGQHVVLELVMLVTSASGAVTGQINGVSYQG